MVRPKTQSAPGGALSKTEPKAVALTAEEQNLKNLFTLQARLEEQSETLGKPKGPQGAADPLAALTANLHVVGNPPAAAVEQAFNAISEAKKKLDLSLKAYAGVLDHVKERINQWEREKPQEAAHVLEAELAELQHNLEVHRGNAATIKARIEELTARIAALTNEHARQQAK